MSRSTPYLRRLVGFGAECVVSPYTPHSWWHEFGRRAMVRRLHAKGFPQLWGWLFVTLTIDPAQFEGPDGVACPVEAYNAGNDRLRRTVVALRASGYSIKRWFWKFELTEAGWPHWHIGLDTRDFIPNAEIDDAWGLGFVKTKRVDRERDFRYMFKYVVKDGGDIPEWLLTYPKRIRVFQTSVGFFGATAGERTSAGKSDSGEAVAAVTLADKFARWGRRVNVRFRDASYRGSAAELSDSVESYVSLFISRVESGGRALDAYHIAVSLESLQEVIKPWKPKSHRNPRPLKLYPSTLWVPFRTASISSDALLSQPKPVPGPRTTKAVLCL